MIRNGHNTFFVSFLVSILICFSHHIPTSSCVSLPLPKIDQYKQHDNHHYDSSFSFTTLSSLSPLQQRTLELNCPPSQDDFRDYDDDDITIYDDRLISLEKMGKKLLSKLRPKTSSSFYEDAVNNIIMALCDTEKEMERCVPSDSPLAAKDWNNQCIITADSTCPDQMCERTSNCYWTKAEHGQNRTTRYPEQEYKKAKEVFFGKRFEKGSYLRNVGTLSLVAFVIAILLLVIWILFFIGRYCCCCLWTSCSCCYLCSPIPKEKGYRVCLEWVLPSIIYFLCLFGLLAAGGMALFGNQIIDDASTKAFSHLSAIIEDLELFLYQSRTPLSNINDIAELAVDDAQSIFNNTSFVKLGAMNIISSLIGYGTLYAEGLSFSNAQNTLDDAIQSFSGQVTPVVIEIQNMLDTLENDFYNNFDSIKAALDSAVGQIDSFREQTDSWQENVLNYESIEYSTRDIRKYSILGICLLPFIVGVIGLIGILCRKNESCKLYRLMNIAGIFSALLGSFMLILASLSLLFSMVWYDACELSTIITSDFEPLLGEKIAQGANAIFNGTNLAIAFNITDKLDFQAKLDEGLSVIQSVNVTEKFETVLGPLEDVQGLVNEISTSAVEVVNAFTNANLILCPFQSTYDKETILQPWLANKGFGNTPWILYDSGLVGSYDRVNDESASEYMKRIYNVAGVCTDDDEANNGTSCCLNESCNGGYGSACNSGLFCEDSICSSTYKTILTAYDAFLDAFDIQQKMTADLGIDCPVSEDSNLTCPTAEFVKMNHNETLVGIVKGYRYQLSETANKLINLTTTNVGKTIDEIQLFLCNMDMSFVSNRYEQVHGDVCVKLLGGFTQVNWSLWVSALVIEAMAILLSILSVRLRGESKRNSYYPNIPSLSSLDEGNRRLSSKGTGSRVDSNLYV